MIKSEEDINCFCFNVSAKTSVVIILILDFFNSLVGFSGGPIGLVCLAVYLTFTIFIILSFKNVQYASFGKIYVILRVIGNVLQLLFGVILMVVYFVANKKECYEFCSLYELFLILGIIFTVSGLISLLFARILHKSLTIIEQSNYRNAIPLAYGYQSA
eukprot:TRINITY_DN0_c3672_g1_i1.p1 TRINITY_DN0_c3672_g1~~TRINITY_DN0_c3672_g1_i1.p1  ORF type:complete len:159 (+),score=31.50 TRINITY_DN0_c3672_g1_i1:56-532(+)